jgi:multiple sugar transport system substrate-binding protein
MMDRTHRFGVVLALLVLTCLPALSRPGSAQTFDWQAQKGTTIRVIQNKSSVGLGIEALLPEFEKLTGIKVQYETYTEDQYRQKVLLELSAGSGGLDAFATYAAQEGLKFWRSGWYEPLDPYLRNPRLTDPAFDLADISKGAVQGNIYDGKLTSLPVQQNTTMLFYRKDLFERLKLKVPQTYAELEETAKRLHNMEEGGQKVVGIVMRGKMAAATSQWAPYLLGMGGTWLTKDGKPAISSPKSVQALDLYGRLLRNYGPPGAVNYHWYECVSLFVQGRAAMYTDVNSRLFQFEDPAKSQVVGKVGYALFPAGPAGRTPTMEAISMAVSSKSKKKEAAYLFVQWAAGKDVALKLLVKGVPVPRASAWKDARFLAEQKHTDWVEASLKSLEIASTEWNPPVIAVSEVRDVVGAAIVSSILGENVKAAADKAAVEMAKIMEKTDGK